jgi:tRNA A37 threonylcarbamoyladenosine biosynthesis protein TsaE|tara:strand:+ start:14363 stop:15976 length:1614 start_codon:yes stop_codon:yes gene_type:complete
LSDDIAGNFDPLDLIDTAIAKGLLAEGAMGLTVVDGADSIPDSLAEARESRKLAEENADDDSSAQEIIILGLVLHGDSDNSTRWAKFRQALGLTPLQVVPDQLWTDRTRLQISAEIDATFRGQRDIRQLNSRALIESYRLRVEREQLTGSLQEFSEAVTAMTAQVEGFHLNDFEMAVQILQSKRARAGLKWLLIQLERGLRADRPVEQVVQLLGEGVEKARSLVAGRLGQDYQFDTCDVISEQLERAMKEEKGETLPTGIDALDIDIQGGVNPRNAGKLLVIAARTGVGKTTLGIAAAMGLVRSGADVLFLSCELDGKEIGARAFSNQAYANNIKIPAWLLEGRGRERNAPDGFQQARDLWIQQEQQGSCGRFVSKSLFHAGAEDFIDYLHSAKSRNPNLSAVYMDHFHAMKPMKGFGNRSQEMEARILLLHQAAKACHVDLFLLAQLNREACLAQKPDLAHINGTDCIAQLASAVWLLEWPKRAEGAEFNPSQLVLHHAKFRNGQRRDGLRVRVEESGLLAGRDFCHITDCGLPFH